MIRTAVEADASDIIAMIGRYRDAVRPDLAMHAPTVAATVAEVLHHPRACAFVWADGQPSGVLLGQAGPSLWWPALEAAPLIWWVDPEVRGTGAGGKLVDAFEAWARAQGAGKVAGVWTGKDARAFFRRRGYRDGDSRMLKDLH